MAEGSKPKLTMDDFCGCVPREDVRDFLLKLLAVDSEGCMANLNLGESISGLIKANPEMAGYVILHFLEEKEVINHGVSIRFPILMDDGPEFVEHLKGWKESDDE